MALTGKEREKKHRKEKERKGLTQACVRIWVKKENAEKCRETMRKAAEKYRANK